MGRHQAWLTAKPSLVSHDQPALCSHDEVREGDTVRGVIVKLTSGAIIAFYNRLTVSIYVEYRNSSMGEALKNEKC